MHYRALLATPLIPPNQEYARLPSDAPYPVDVAALNTLLDSLFLS